MKTIPLVFIISLFIHGAVSDEMVSVMVGDSLTLHTNLDDIKKKTEIEWRFEHEKTSLRLLRIDDDGTELYNGTVGSFTGRLKINYKTGDLTITNISSTDAGRYNLATYSTETGRRKNTFSVRVSGGEVTSVSVNEGDSVTLHTSLTDIQTDYGIRWRFQHGDSPLAELNRKAGIFSKHDDVLDGRFKERLMLDHQTGSLTITNIRMKHAGLYELDFIRGTHTIHKPFIVTVSGGVKSGPVMEGRSVTLHTNLTEIQTDDVIQWMFVDDDSLIAEILKQTSIFITYNGANERFRDKLKLDEQTGSLIIRNFRKDDSGLYELKISSTRRSIQRRINVSIDSGLSSGAVAGICFLFLLVIAAAAVGVFYYHQKFREAQELLYGMLKVMEEDDVVLSTGLTELLSDDKIQWEFEGVVIAEINKGFTKINDGSDGRFTDRLEINRQNGDLTISETRITHSGDYLLKIDGRGKRTVKKYTVSVTDKRITVQEGESVILRALIRNLQTDDVIQWMFGDKETLIAEIKPANNIFRTHDGGNGLFKDKLNLHMSGNLTIKNIRRKHNGVYQLKITSGGQTSCRKFNVSVSGKIETMSVKEGDPVVLKTLVNELQTDDVIQWMFGNKNTLIAEINPASNIFRTHDDVMEGLFRDALKLNHQTGDLIINNIRKKHTGHYRLNINRKNVSSRTFIVFVTEYVKVPDSVDIEMPLLSGYNHQQ